MSPDAALAPIGEALWLFAGLAAPVALAVAIVAAIGAMTRRIRPESGGLVLRWLAVGAALVIAGPLMADALLRFARWSWGGP